MMQRPVPSRFYRKAQQLDSHINRVTRSLEHLVFSGAKERRRTLFRKRVVYFATFFCLLLTLGFTLSPHGGAETAFFYPQTCLGGWRNPSLAKGEPETDLRGAPYSDVTAAFLSTNTSADIFCGEFTGEIPKDSVPNGVIVRLFLSYDGTSSSTVITGDDFISNVTEILDGIASTSPDFTLTSTSTEQSEATTTEAEITPEEEEGTEVPAPASDTPAEGSVQQGIEPLPETTDPAPLESYNTFKDMGDALRRLLTKHIVHAYAEEDVVSIDPLEENATDTHGSSTDTLIENQILESEVATSTTEQLSPLFEVLYTLDGNEWNTLGYINKNELQGAQFIVPFNASSTWLEVSRIQIQLKRLATFDDIPDIYLDGMSLEVAYAKQQELKEELSGDPKRYDIAVATSSDDLHVSVGKGEEGVFVNIGVLSGGQLFIYDDKDAIKYSIGVGSDPVSVSSYMFEPGPYTAVMTNRENGCGGLTLAQCLNDKKTIGYSEFSIIPTRETPTEYLPLSKE